MERARALRSMAEYRTGSADQAPSPFETEMARKRLAAFLAKNGLVHADLDQNVRAAAWPGPDGDRDWTVPKPHERRVVHRMEGFTSPGGRARAWCRCGYGAKPRADREQALSALRAEHPSDPPVCCLCGRDYTDSGWMSIRDGLQVLVDNRDGEFMCCDDFTSCTARF
ncbi:predicted protein [Streptomyces sp. AA4]|nr:predicted protein [Streptomyces sp. AA4]